MSEALEKARELVGWTRSPGYSRKDFASAIEALIDAKIDARAPVAIIECEDCSARVLDLNAPSSHSPAQGAPERGEVGWLLKQARWTALGLEVEDILKPGKVVPISIEQTGALVALLRRLYDEALAGGRELRTAQSRIAKLERERDRAREILADTDAASLPKDHSLELTARARIIQMRSAEAEATRLRKAIEDILPYVESADVQTRLTAALSPPNA